MDILVLGGDGFIGRHLCAVLDERGHEVTELSRTADPDVLPDDVDTLRGNVIDYDSIASAFDGRDAVVNLVALSPMTRPEGGEERHLEVHLGGTKNVLRAAKEHGIARVERGYVTIVPGTDIGERVKIEVAEVKSNFAVGEVIDDVFE